MNQILNSTFQILNSKIPSLVLRPSSIFHPLPPIPFIYTPPSYRRELPIIFWPFSISLITINLHQNLITIDKPNTYEPIAIFTNVKNIRQIRLFMQNKPKVKRGNIDKIRPVHVFARAGSLTITIYDFTRGNLPPYKGVSLIFLFVNCILCSQFTMQLIKLSI